MKSKLLLISLIIVTCSCTQNNSIIKLDEKNNFMVTDNPDTLHIDESKSIELDISEYPSSSHLLLEFADRMYWMSIDPKKNSNANLSPQKLIAINSRKFDGFFSGESMRIYLGRKRGESPTEMNGDYLSIIKVR